jgi:ABC-2 type transport system ATP-binding protein
MSPDGTISAYRIWKRFQAEKTGRRISSKLRNWRTYLPGRRGWNWALRDVSVEIEPGESVALIGRNGSGKSTLLKILGRVMYPHAGVLDVQGRIGALIEVRAGIHPDLTGRENVELFGTLLGLTRTAVRARFDEIIEFAELNDAVDRQVKFYSSGMQMRLGFSVAAFLEPDVLLVDEVLAVGDASFQQKCLDRMREVLQSGTTLVFVSHDLAAVEAVCDRVVWLDDGLVRSDGDAGDVLSLYRMAVEEQAVEGRSMGGAVEVVGTTVRGPGGADVQTGGDVDIELVIASREARSIGLNVGVSDGTASPILLVRHAVDLERGNTVVRCRLEQLPLATGRYYVWAGAFTRKGDILPWQPLAHLVVRGGSLDKAPSGIVRLAPVYVDASWDVVPVDSTIPRRIVG